MIEDGVALALRGVSVDIAGVPVLRRVTLEVPPGGRVALIGRNGAGKTTCLRTLMGLLAPREGCVVLTGFDAGTTPAHHRPRLGIGYAPEERRLFGSFTVQQNLLLPAQVLKLPTLEVARRLEAVLTLLPELRELAPRRAAGLSGGQGKMVALGRALMVGTSAVLLDEPFQGLAPALAQRYAEVLRRLHQVFPGVAMLITESNPELLRPLVEATYVIERGEIAPAGAATGAQKLAGQDGRS
jgi:branched-chain amino acid transport system ATP-binding protein